MKGGPCAPAFPKKNMVYGHLRKAYKTFKKHKKSYAKVGAVAAAGGSARGGHGGHSSQKHASVKKVKYKKKQKTTAPAASLNDLHSGVTSSVFNVVVNPKVPKGFLKHGPIKFDEFYTVAPVISTLNGQGVITLCNVGTAIPWLATGTTASPNTSIINYFDLNPMCTNTGSVAISSQVRPSSSKMYLKSSTVTITAVNLSSIGMYVDIYCVQAKKLIERTSITAANTYSDKFPIDVWTDALANQGLGKADQSASLLGNEIISMPFARPKEAYGFNKLFSVKRVHHLNLAAAAEEEVTFNCKMNVVFDGLKLVQDNVNQATGGIGGPTNNIRVDLVRGGLGFFAVVRGGIAKDAGAGGSNALVISNPEVGFTVCRKQRFGLLKAPDAKWQETWAQKNVTVPTGLGISHINIDDVNQGVVNV